MTMPLLVVACVVLALTASPAAAVPEAQVARHQRKGTKDGYGCARGSGFAWCAATRRCQRDWEEPCPSTVPLLLVAAPTAACMPEGGACTAYASSGTAL